MKKNNDDVKILKIIESHTVMLRYINEQLIKINEKLQSQALNEDESLEEGCSPDLQNSNIPLLSSKDIQKHAKILTDRFGGLNNFTISISKNKKKNIKKIVR